MLRRLKYVASDDIQSYSIDEVFIDATHYLSSFHISAHDFAMRIILDVLKTTGITATAGIGPNLYLAKVAMDVWAKHVPADENGVRIAQLDEMSYREKLWAYRPLTGFWRVGTGYTKKLEAMGLYTMGDIARCSLGKPTDFYNEDTLYVEIPPKMSVAGYIGFLKGKSSLVIFQRHGNLKYKYGNRSFWCRGYYVDTAGKNTKKIA